MAMTMTDLLLMTIFLSFPEAICILLLGLHLCNIKISFKKVILAALIQAGIAFIINIIDIPFGGHTIIQVISLWVIVTYIFRIKLYKSIVPVLIGFLIVAISQGVIIYIANLFITIDFLRLGVNFIYTFIFSIPNFVLFIFLIFLVNKSHIVLCDILEGEVFGK